MRVISPHPSRGSHDGRRARRPRIETHQLKSRTRRGYRSTLNAHLVPFFGAYRLVKITPALFRTAPGPRR